VDFTGGATFVFDVIVHELEWDKVGVDVPVIVGNPDAQINGIVDFSGSVVRLELTEDPLPGMTVDLVDNTGVGEIVAPAGFEFSHGDFALWDTTQFTTNGQITYGGAPQGIIGDYNSNGTVEQADLDLVLLNWGQPGVPAGWTNDLPEGNIDQAELDGVLLNWGNRRLRRFPQIGTARQTRGNEHNRTLSNRHLREMAGTQSLESPLPNLSICEYLRNLRTNRQRLTS
jgi:hypothetical protein